MYGLKQNTYTKNSRFSYIWTGRPEISNHRVASLLKTGRAIYEFLLYMQTHQALLLWDNCISGSDPAKQLKNDGDQPVYVFEKMEQ